jgi:hypothetical protein
MKLKSLKNFLEMIPKQVMCKNPLGNHSHKYFQKYTQTKIFCSLRVPYVPSGDSEGTEKYRYRRI